LAEATVPRPPGRYAGTEEDVQNIPGLVNRTP
jgi:hypothetical protein